MRDNDIRLVSDYLVNISNRIFRGYDLRIAVAISSDTPILVAIAQGKLTPAIHKIAVFLGHLLIRIRLPDRLSLTPYAHIRILRFYKLDKSVIIVILTIPHSILDVPVKESQSLLMIIAASHKKKGCKQEQSNSFHINNWLQFQ
jgi:hypothetical protein